VGSCKPSRLPWLVNDISGDNTVLMRTINSLRSRWRALRLVQQFVLAAALVLVGGMSAMGWWVSDRISNAVTENTAYAAALYMESAISPLVQELEHSDRLSEGALSRIDALLDSPSVRERIISIKIWRTDGTIAYSKWREMVGQAFPPSPSFQQALSGVVAAELDNDPHLEDHNERAIGMPLLEIYAPVRAIKSDRIIAVSEIYAKADKLTADLLQAKWWSWLVVGAVTVSMMLLLSSIVARGSRTIEEQRSQLKAQISELETLLSKTEDLGQKLRNANERVAEINEQVLQRIGADLHDGPAQLLTYSLLRLNKFTPMVEHVAGGDGVREFQQARSAVSDALEEVRNISAGLVQPRLAAATLADVVKIAVSQHQEHTGTKVILEIEDNGTDIPLNVKLCVYRVVQEALTNAHRHAQGWDQRVRTVIADGLILVSIGDGGAGFDPSVNDGNGRLGICGMQARVEALGGTLDIVSRIGNGTELTARFDTSALTTLRGV
jgi:signal transduction histidine kinase